MYVFATSQLLKTLGKRVQFAKIPHFPYNDL